jgi:hypothetical protein
MINGMKVCSICKEPKELSQFGSDKSSKDGKNHRCKPCYNTYMLNAHHTTRRDANNARARKWHHSHKTKAKDTALRRKFSIGIDEYNKLAAEQNNLCAICKNPNTLRMLVVDHNHATDKIRGLLCDHCNKGLGFFKDNTDLLTEAINYIKINE